MTFLGTLAGLLWWYAFIVHIYEMFGVSSLSIVISLTSAVSAISPVLGGIIAKYIDRRRIILFRYITYSMLLYLLSTVTKFYIIVLCLMLIYAVASLASPSISSLIADYSNKKTYGTSYSLIWFSRIIGYCIGPLIGGLIIHLLGLNYSLVIASLFSISSAATSLLLRKVEANTNSSTSYGMRGISDLLNFLRKAIKRKKLLSLLLYTLIDGSCMGLLSIGEPLYMKEALRMKKYEVNYAFGILHVGDAIFSIPSGKISDKIGRDKCVILAVMANSLFTIMFANNRSKLLLIPIMLGIGCVGTLAAIAYRAAVAEVTETSDRALMFGCIRSTYRIGGIISPLIVPLIIMYGLSMPLYIAATLWLLSAILIYYAFIWGKDERHINKSSQKSSQLKEDL